MARNVTCSSRGNIYSTGIYRLKILNILAFSTKSHYQKIHFGHLGLKKLGICFLELMKPNNL